jgi:ABC-2 type transport system ATP-binding protein
LTEIVGQVIVETVNLTKRYGQLTAVDGLNLKIEKGSIFGLLGPNGAGKTTTILMLLGLTEPTDGNVLISGYDPTHNPLKVKAIVGYLPDNVGFYQELTGLENLRYTAELNGLQRDMAQSRINNALERVGLKDSANRKVGEYSRGMRQRLGVADVLVKDPPLIIMDEPTLGIDPEGVRDMLRLIKNLAVEDGRTIILSSHLLHQVQEICDRVGIFVKGRMIASGAIDELGSQLLAGEELVIEVIAEPFDEELINICKSKDGVQDIKKRGRMLILHCAKDIRQFLSKTIVDSGYKLLHMYLRGVSLDDIYQRYFQKEGYDGRNEYI